MRERCRSTSTTRAMNTEYTIAKQSQANHGGPKIARMAREKSVRALSSGKKHHMTLAMMATATTIHLLRGWRRTSVQIVMTLKARKRARTAATISTTRDMGA